MSPGLNSRIFPLVLTAILTGFAENASDRGRKSEIIGAFCVARWMVAGGSEDLTGSSTESASPVSAILALYDSFIFAATECLAECRKYKTVPASGCDSAST
jgi:ABC-type xylose transport system substrate-binding protein